MKVEKLERIIKIKIKIKFYYLTNIWGFKGEFRKEGPTSLLLSIPK